MGLTIHYSLKSDASKAAEARRLVERLHQRALDLPFESVGEVVELIGDECDFKKLDRNDPNCWLLIQARHYLFRGEKHFEVTPLHAIAFTILPGDGCESANVGLCTYPRTIEVVDQSKGTSQSRRIKTNLTGWSWESFCKTQYASNPDCGGVENFLRCHLTLVKLLDYVAELGVLGEVKDESGYWESRDMESLVKEVGEWNTMIAAIAGRMKDALGDGAVAEITKFPDFERLEAKGRDRRKKKGE